MCIRDRLLPIIGPLALLLIPAGLAFVFYKKYRIQVEKARYASLLTRLNDAERLEKEIRNYERKIEQLSNTYNTLLTEIPECHRQRLQGDIEEDSKALRQVIEEERQEELNLKSGIEAIKARLDNLEMTINQLEKDIQRSKEEINKKINELKKYEAESHRVEQELSSLHPPEKAIPIINLQNVEDLGNVEHLLRVYKENQEKTQEIKNRFEEQLKMITQFIKNNTENVAKIDKVRQEIERLEKEISDTEPQIAVLEMIVKSLSDISVKLRGSFAPSVERFMGRILNVITDGRYKAVKIDPKSYDVQVFDSETGRFLPRNIYSGGTNDQFLLAMRIAFTLALLRGAKGTYPRFLFLDEPLGSSDPERRRRILKLLSEELTKYFEQIVLITHVEIPEISNARIITMENGKVVGERRITEVPEIEV